MSQQATVFQSDGTGPKEKQQKLRNVGIYDALVKIDYSGFCHTDMLYWKLKGLTPGHEVVGTVVSVGDHVHHLKKGDRVGASYLQSSCGDCEQCLSGKDILCPEREIFGERNREQGGFGSHLVWDARYLVKIPDSLETKYVGPLLCAGATVFAAMYNNNIRATDSVGIVGIGGLGHLALQYSHRFGCHTVAFSTTDNKKAEAEKLGCDEFVTTKGKDKYDVSRKLDAIIFTLAVKVDLDPYFDCLKPGGKFILVGVPPDGKMTTSFKHVGQREKPLVGSMVASRFILNKMLDFSARWNIVPMIEELDMTEENISKAYKKLEDNAVRYRIVLKAPAGNDSKKASL